MHRLFIVALSTAVAVVLVAPIHAQDITLPNEPVILGTDGIHVIETGRKVIVGTVAPGTNTFQWNEDGRLLVGPGSSVFVMDEDRAAASDKSGDGLSDTFFIRSVPEGTTDFVPAEKSETVLVDTWTNFVLTGESPPDSSLPDKRESPVTAWTGSVQGGDGILQPQ